MTYGGALSECTCGGRDQGREGVDMIAKMKHAAVRTIRSSSIVGPWSDGSTSKLSLAEGEWAGPLKPPE